MDETDLLMIRLLTKQFLNNVKEETESKYKECLEEIVEILWKEYEKLK